MSHSPMVREFGLWGWGRMWRKRADPLLNWMRHNNCLISDVLVFFQDLKKKKKLKIQPDCTPANKSFIREAIPYVPCKNLTSSISFNSTVELWHLHGKNWIVSFLAPRVSNQAAVRALSYFPGSSLPISVSTCLLSEEFSRLMRRITSRCSPLSRWD